MRLLDRYVLRNFFEPFLLCFFGFIAILMIFDLYDNGPDFIQYHTPIKVVAQFYLTQLPAMTLISLPIGLLLALLFALSRMSRHNEIISMLTAGCSVVRVITPLVIIGIIATAGCFLLNSAAAPHAEALKKKILDEITRGAKRREARETLEGHLFRDRLSDRTWYVRRLRPNTNELVGVHITQQDPDGNIVRKWYASKAIYDPKLALWALYNGMIMEFDRDGDIVRTDAFPNAVRVENAWKETPWRIASSQMQAQNLSIAELRDYLRFNSDFPPATLAPYRTYLYDRFAVPWSCLVLVFIAAPLGIVYNRRGVLGGVASAIFLFICTIVAHSLLLAFGKGYRMDPMAAAWLPHVSFFAIGLILLYFRSTNREIKFAFWR